MPTKLTKPVRRRIGDLVVTIDREALHVRQTHCRSGVSIGWSELAAAVDQPATIREAFEQPVPYGWAPRAGETVFVRREPSRTSRTGRLERTSYRVGTVRATLPAVPDPLYRIDVPAAGGRVVTITVFRGQIRPCQYLVVKLSNGRANKRIKP